ncbi:MAG TPA: hypothetical protein VHM69_07225 [Rubrobacter sp.]|nr:hypothetical protein [Rubrobacter sp.]
MTVNIVGAARDRGLFASPIGDEETFLLLLAAKDARYIREQEEAAIDEEDFWTQAEEANAIDPIG